MDSTRVKDQLQIEFTKFGPEYFDEYRHWFADATLARALGPAPDEEWLEHIQHDDSGSQFAVLAAGELVAVVGIVFPIEEAAYSVITDFAVRPNLRKTGVGTQVLDQLLTVQPPGPWRAYVEKTNVAAKQFFQQNGWARAV